MSALSLSLALDRYDRHFPFFDGTVTAPQGVALEVLQVGQSQDWRDGGARHERMYHDGAFDICEFGLSPYVMLHDRNPDLPFVALPVFPRRLFSQSQMFVHTDSGIFRPEDLAGRRVALRSFHTTLSVLAKGDLKFHHRVPWEDIIWRPSKPELMDYDYKDGVRVEPLPDGMDLDLALEAGEVDAIFVPHPPKSVLSGNGRMRRLFPDCRAEEARYYKACGAFPIMHLVVIRRDLIEREPWLGHAIIDMFADAKRISDGYLDDPNWSRLAWGRQIYLRSPWIRFPPPR